MSETANAYRCLLCKNALIRMGLNSMGLAIAAKKRRAPGNAPNEFTNQLASSRRGRFGRPVA
jgi:hypothetical protein